jgi:glycosyltransferase involved in cell wall biosynthesis
MATSHDVDGEPRRHYEPIRIALLGTRGVPASYSGFETCVEQLGQRLAARGHHVTVYCRSHHTPYPGEMYKGMRLVKLPTIRHKYLDTLVHTTISSLHALRQRYDVALYFIAGNSPTTWIPRLVGTKTVLQVGGLDSTREKWPPLAKMYIRLAERLATVLPNAYLTDSRAVRESYRERYGKQPPVISYGSEVEIVPAGATLSRLALRPRDYILFVGRLVPENCAHHLVDAFRRLDTGMKCVIVGDAPYAEAYQAQLRAAALGDDRIIFTGYLFGSGYQELGSHAHLFVETSGAGGTHPALLEAMGFGNCVVANGTPENRETIGDAGLAYDGAGGADALAPLLAELLRNPSTVEDYRRRASRFAAQHYSWEAVTTQYEDLFASLLEKTKQGVSI